MVDLRGASADAVAVLTERLGDGSPKVAADLFAAAQALRAEGALRRFATDASLPDEAKTGLVQQVFRGKIDAAGLDVLSTAVTRRWTAARDLADALEHLSVVALVRSSRGDSGRLADELFSVGQLVKNEGDLRDALSDPARSTADKAGLLESLLGGKVLAATLTLAQQALSGSYRTVSAALSAYEKTAAEVHGEGVATVRVARPLTDAEQRRLTEALTRQYDRPVHVNLVVQPDLIGGVRVEIGDDVIDGTVSSRLDDARRRIAG